MNGVKKLLWWVFGMAIICIVIPLIVTMGGIAFSAFVGVFAVAWPIVILLAIGGTVLFVCDHRKK